MDHIPTPRVPKHPPPEIRCFARPQFVPSGSPYFEEYPASRGWQLKGLRAGDFSQGHTEEESREFLQEWLYFKVMAAIFGAVGIDIDMDDFTRRSDGQLLIDSNNLVRYISDFERCFRELGTPAQLESAREINNVLTLTQLLVVRECSMTSGAQVRSKSWPFDLYTSLSFMILGCTLTFAVSRIIQVMPDKTHALKIWQQLMVSHHGWGMSEVLYERMRSSGWCLHSLAQFASTERSVIGMYYASLLEIVSDGNDHAGCKVRECLRMTVNEGTYETAHIGPLPCCSAVVPDRHKIIQCLAFGKIPILRLQETGATASFEADVIPWEKGMRYVAISHVWAHGLGNVKGNWLYKCQMQKLYNLAKALYPFTSTLSDTLIWIDTICVPRKRKEDSSDYRKTAIDLLSHTYQNADKVLVLDAQISRSTSRVTPEESLMRILSSQWMTRLWTLQEGLLADKLRFQFQELALGAEDMLSNIMPIHHSSVWLETYEFFCSLRDFKTTPPQRKLQRLWNYLQWRNTSHASDETICLSILTGKQPSNVLNVPHANRMKTFLEQMDGVPSNIIFMPGPRLSELGWGWAPTSSWHDTSGRRTSIFKRPLSLALLTIQSLAKRISLNCFRKACESTSAEFRC